MKEVLSVRSLSYSFGKIKVLDNIDLSLQKGDFLGVIGPNGAGKTTLLKLVLGIYPVKEGSIIKLNPDRIGYVPQKVTNFDKNFPATVYEVVGMGIKKGVPKLLRKHDEYKVLEVLKKVGMQKYMRRRIGELSGGQQQRVFIARSLVSEPEILFLDEPTTGVDIGTQNRFYELLKDLNRTGITVVLVSHDIGRITKYVKKIAYLNHKLVFYGEHKDFCSYDKKHNNNDHNICLH